MDASLSSWLLFFAGFVIVIYATLASGRVPGSFPRFFTSTTTSIAPPLAPRLRRHHQCLLNLSALIPLLVAQYLLTPDTRDSSSRQHRVHESDEDVALARRLVGSSMGKRGLNRTGPTFPEARRPQYRNSAPVRLPIAVPVGCAARGSGVAAAVSQTTLSGPFSPPPLSGALGATVVLGAGRVLGSAVVALLADRNASVRAVDDGTSGLVTLVDFRVVLDEVDVTAAGGLDRAFSGGSVDTVFVDLDPDLPVAPCAVPLACELAGLRVSGGGGLAAKRVIFLRDGAGAASLASVLATCPASASAVPQLGLLQWGDALIAGVGSDPVLAGVPTDALAQGLRCLADTADAMPYATHGFNTTPVVLEFFRAAGPGGACGPAVRAAAVLAGLRGLHAANAASDALVAAFALASSPPSSNSGSPAGAGGALQLAVFSRDAQPGAICPFAPARVLRNSLPSLEVFAPSAELALFYGHVDGAGGDAARVAFTDIAWWVWRQALFNGFRFPEPLASYDPAVDLASGVAPESKATIHDICTFGITLLRNHNKARYSQATWGWRFKRGGIPWSSNRADELLPTFVFEPPEGSAYSLLTLRTTPVWAWAVETYPRYAWTVRMFDDNFPLVERYVDIASLFNPLAPVAIGRLGAIMRRRRGIASFAPTTWMGGGAPALYSRALVDHLRGGGVDTCIALFERFTGKTAAERPIAPLVGRGMGKVNRMRAAVYDVTGCGLNCEDVLTEWCLRDALGVYFQQIEWQGFQHLAPRTLNEWGLYTCKALTCRRRVPLKGPGVSNDIPHQSVVWHYVSASDMERLERELYGLAPGSREWVDLCEAAQEHPECVHEVVAMPLPAPWAASETT